jgi:putative transcriptional regulator
MTDTVVSTLKDRRTAAGLTQADLADLVQVSRKTINTIENAVFIPSTLLSLRIARVLNCRVEDIFALAPDDPTRNDSRDNL